MEAGGTRHLLNSGGATMDSLSRILGIMGRDNRAALIYGQLKIRYQQIPCQA